MHKKLCLLENWGAVLLAFFLFPTMAQSQDTRQHFWIDAYNYFDLGPKWIYEFNPGLKIQANGERHTRYKFRNSLSYALSEKVSLINGLDYHMSADKAHKGNWEIRAWQAVKLKCLLFKTVPIANLLAFEERVMRFLGETRASLMGRVRYEFGVNVPLMVNPLYLPLSQDVYLNTGKSALRFAHISRTNLGLGCRVNDFIRAEVLFVKQHTLNYGERTFRLTDNLFRFKLRYNWN